ncbi:PAS domain S-box protein [Gracilibacillus oryzae]|uniref:PAS domain S-box protein n=1 Tax=Gracilibacillus oryzae TaxID=1672701 RepID=A0A7C8GUH2_9BACI|nr:PAS domain S-box protein [Gracilibacillus oryzae]KAB8138201.1 PAS domain S-box protein [Gracilibacillus oryzae]
MSENISEVDYREVIEYSLDPLIIHTNNRIIYINQAAETFFRTNKEDVMDKSPLDIFQDSSKSAISNRIQAAYDRPAEIIEERIFRWDGTEVDVELYCHPVLLGDTKAIQTYVKDISDNKQYEKRQQDMQKAINELSATIVPVLDEIGILPLTGKIDQDQAAQILEVIPNKVQAQSISYLIIDFSGVYTLDNVVIDNLFRIYNVLSLLGVQPIITGLRPDLAVEATSLNMDLSSFETMATVKEALSSFGLTANLDSA